MCLRNLLYLSLATSLSVTSTPVWAGHNASAGAPHVQAARGAAPAAPHMAAPRQSAPGIAAAPHIEAAHRIEVPRTPEPRRESPRPVTHGGAIPRGSEYGNLRYEQPREPFKHDFVPLTHSVSSRPDYNNASSYAVHAAEMNPVLSRVPEISRSIAMSNGHFNGERTFAGPASYHNPRVASERPSQFSERPSNPLNFRGGGKNLARHLPREGSARSGMAGPVNPGGYIRDGVRGANFVTPQLARRQFAGANPNYVNTAAANYRNLVQNRGNWPWSLPAYAPGWFSNNPDNSFWWQNGGRDWSYGPSLFNGWGGSLPWFMSICNMLPWGCNSQMGWVPYVGYYNGYTVDGQTYPASYFAQNGYCPTAIVFDVARGQFWVPGQGYVNRLPDDYTAPITVAVQESVPQYNFVGQISGYKIETFNYNAYWNDKEEAYGYYDYRQQFHWLTFPWLNSWS